MSNTCLRFHVLKIENSNTCSFTTSSGSSRNSNKWFKRSRRRFCFTDWCIYVIQKISCWVRRIQVSSFRSINCRTTAYCNKTVNLAILSELDSMLERHISRFYFCVLVHNIVDLVINKRLFYLRKRAIFYFGDVFICKNSDFGTFQVYHIFTNLSCYALTIPDIRSSHFKGVVSFIASYGVKGTLGICDALSALWSVLSSQCGT
mmetsp:Transcript_1437/g.1616  ORF Transcript_1437/g.1616 Transcript_1437/m.1616 type:complete len:204 (-) Transcript_1437:77-688(-)